MNETPPAEMPFHYPVLDQGVAGRKKKNQKKWLTEIVSGKFEIMDQIIPLHWQNNKQTALKLSAGVRAL